MIEVAVARQVDQPTSLCMQYMFSRKMVFEVTRFDLNLKENKQPGVKRKS